LISQKLLDKFPAGQAHTPSPSLAASLDVFSPVPDGMGFDGRKCKDCDTFFSWLFVWRRDTCFRFILKKISDSQNESSFRDDS
jgi:hypothetical protein